MSDQILGKYQFLSWARQGIGASLTTCADGTTKNRGCASVQVSVADQDGTNYGTQPKAVNVQVSGPGDVIGIDPRCVVATEPPNGTANFESNYLCAIEFDSPYFPWMMTPLTSTPAPTPSTQSGCLSAGDQLLPWVALIALKTGVEFNPPQQPDKTKPLRFIEILPEHMDALQDLSESATWAHVQVTGDKSIAESPSGNVISRVLCPRSLEPETSYTAFLVPVFEIGRLAGLGEPVPLVPTLDFAWPPPGLQTTPTNSLQLPFYFQFEFHTSDAADFESLVRRLNPIDKLPGGSLPESVGKRPMDVTDPFPGIRSAGTTPLGQEGALKSPSMHSTDWQGADKDNFQSDVAAWIGNTTPETDDPAKPNPRDPEVAPPIYGQWLAVVHGVHPGSNKWIDELNLDPRYRSAAGMGTQAVQRDRAQLIHSAWQQVDGILEANQKIKQAQLARAALQQLYTNHFVQASPETILNLTAPLQTRVRYGTTTVRAEVRNSRVPERAFSPAFRIMTRPRRRLGVSPSRRPALIGGINKGQLQLVPPVKALAGLVSVEQVTDKRSRSLEKRLLEVLAALELARRRSHGITRRLFLLLLLGVAAVGIGAGVVGATIVQELEDLFEGSNKTKKIRLSSFTAKTVATIPERPNFVITAPGVQPGRGRAGVGDSATAKAFRGATQTLFAAYESRPAEPQERPSLDFSNLQTTIVNRLDPNITVAGRTQALISFPRISWSPRDFLASPILHGPVFSQPMYQPLRDLSPSYILPSADQVPQNSVSGVLQNHKFIEAYMGGVNHEMARQLMWEDYPTYNQQNTYFQQFWDVSSYIPQSGDPKDPIKLAELLNDIPPIEDWDKPKPLPLGQHFNRRDLPPDKVVLLIRGELFQRYPKAPVYACKAKRDANANLVLDESNERHPIFRGTLPPDMTFFGFNLSAKDAWGGTRSSPEGYFFVFEQEPSGIRFGLEPTDSTDCVQTWADLAWVNFASDGTGACTQKTPSKFCPQTSQVFAKTLANRAIPKFLSPKMQPSNVSLACDPTSPLMCAEDKQNCWGMNSAQTAYILLRLPFRVVMHAKLVLPSPTAGPKP